MKMQVREIRMIADIFALAENIWQMDAPE